jgi:hypothetical protein
MIAYRIFKVTVFVGATILGAFLIRELGFLAHDYLCDCGTTPTRAFTASVLPQCVPSAQILYFIFLRDYRPASNEFEVEAGG